MKITNFLSRFATALLVAVMGLSAVPVYATVTVNTAVTSLVTAPKLVKASSAQIPVFSFALSQSAGETLSSVTVTVNHVGSSTVSSGDLAGVSVYLDNGNGNFEPGIDLLAGTQSTVNIDAPTTITTASNNTLGATATKFFVTLATGATWSDTSPADSVTVSLGTNGIVTSANSPVTVLATTDTITADTTAPTLVSAKALNTGGTNAKEAGDSVELMFSESTNAPAITAGTLATYFTLNNSHSFLDGAGALGSGTWSVDGKTFTITLSAGTSLPTVVVGDSATVTSLVTDTAGNTATGTQAITGNFGGKLDDEDGDEDGDHEGKHGVCANTLKNGRLYKIGTAPTVYLASACRLKPFRGNAVFKARGHKFQDITVLPTLPAGVTISDKPVLPAEGTLVKGSNATVFFVDSHGKKKGFVSGHVFLALGFNFKQVQQISDTDLALITTDTNIDNEQEHPDGALIKCGNSGTVFEVIDGSRFPFANAEAFNDRGHSFDHILVVDCGRFRYVQGAPVN